MSTKRQPSKQKRAAQNRAERAARAARAANANAAPRRSEPAGAAGGGGSLLSRLRGGSSGGGSAAARGAALRPDQPPGYRAALSGVFAAAAAVLLCTFALRYPVDGQGDVYTPETRTADFAITAARAAAEQPEATAAEVAENIDDWSPEARRSTVVQALWPFSLAIVLPLIGAGIGFHTVRKRSSSKVVNRALYATLFGAVLTQGLLLLFLPVVLAMGVAMFQVRKTEAAAAALAASGGVIDVAEAEPADVVDEVIDIDAVVDEDGPEPDDAAS